MKAMYRWMIALLVVACVGAAVTLTLFIKFDKPINNHVHTEVVDEGISPTCTDVGYTEGKYCATCGEVIVEQTEIPALGHMEVIDEAVEAKYPNTGLTEGKHCSRCGIVIVEQSVVAIPSYTVIWNFSGGSIHNSDGQEVKNRLTYKSMYGQQLLPPVYNNAPDGIAGPYFGTAYNFDGWYTDSACTNLVDTSTLIMPAGNLTLYAGRTAQTFILTFDFGMDKLNEQLPTGLPDDGRYVPTHPNATDPDNPLVISSYSYTVDQIISTGVVRLTAPTLNGFKFISWAYEDDDHVEHKISTITRTTAGNYSLYAIWEPLEYTITLNSNGGDRITPNYVKIKNLNYCPVEVSYAGGDYGDDLLVPERAGFTFIGWSFSNSPTAHIVTVADLFDCSICGTTFYAQWSANPVKIVYANDVDDSLFDIAIELDAYPGQTFVPSDTQNADNDWLYKDSILTIRVTPVAGYEIASITISGVSFTNGGRYTVRTYADDTMVLDVKLNERLYGITYMYNGGTYSGTERPAQNFALSQTIQVPGAGLVNKVGYEFRGWTLEPDSDNPSTVGDFTQAMSDVVCADEFGANPVTLYALWEASHVTMVYHNNYTVLGQDGSIQASEQTYTVADSDDIVTGATIALWYPDDETFVPANRRLIGWATTAGGDVVYNVTYESSVGDDGEIQYIPQAVYYTVQSSVGNVNHLYAVWQVITED